MGACLSSKRALPLPLGLPVSAFCLGLLLRALIHQLGWTHGGFRADSGRVSGGFRRFPRVSGIVSDATRLKKHWESDNVEYSWKGFPPAEHAINIILRDRNAFRGTRHNVNDPRQDNITAREHRGSSCKQARSIRK